MLQIRFLISTIFIFAIGLASVQISVSGEEIEFSLNNTHSLSLAGSLRSGDLLLETTNIGEARELLEGTTNMIHYIFREIEEDATVH